MKKFLLSTTAFGLALGVGVIAVDAVHAKAATKPVLRIDGRMKGTFHIFDNDNDVNLGGKGDFGHGTHFAVEDSRLNFMVIGRADWLGQFFYDWKLGLTGDTAANKNPVEENRIRVKAEWGTVMFGNTQGVENFMARGAYGVMGATGGFDGNWTSVINAPTGILKGTDLVGTSKYATKANYVTPRLFGVQAGVSYAVNSEQKGEKGPHNLDSVKSPKEAFGMNVWSGAINFLHEFNNGFNLALSATGIASNTRSPERGTANFTNLATVQQTASRHRTAAYAIGGVAEFRGFEFGAEWMDNGKSQQIKSASQLNANLPVGQRLDKVGKFDAGQAYSFALGYTYGPDKFAIGYYHSEREFNGHDAKTDIYSVTYDRKLAPGLSVFAEYNILGLRNHPDIVEWQRAVNSADGNLPKAIENNNARHVAMGVKFQF